MGKDLRNRRKILQKGEKEKQNERKNETAKRV